MRALLEFLGIVTPDDSRREPVALPAWTRRLMPLLVAVLTVLSTLVYSVVRAWLG
jgi:hypothetical protein